MILPVSYKINLNFERDKVWSVLAEKEHLNLFHPFCKKNEAQSWDNKTKRDSLEYLNGVILHRDFFEWNEHIQFKSLDTAHTRVSTFVTLKSLSNKSRLFMYAEETHKQNVANNYIKLKSLIE